MFLNVAVEIKQQLFYSKGVSSPASHLQLQRLIITTELEQNNLCKCADLKELFLLQVWENKTIQSEYIEQRKTASEPRRYNNLFCFMQTFV